MNEHRKNAILNLGILIVFIILFDQVTKQVVIHNIGLNESKPLIKDVFELYHINNSGSAWGMMSGKTIFLTALSIILSGAVVYVLIHLLNDPYYRALRFCLGCILGGAVGNLIDRIRLGYVTDFLYFKLINFPVFNVADIFVTVPIILMVLLLIFKYKGDDLDVALGDKIRLADGTYQSKKKKKDKTKGEMKNETREDGKINGADEKTDGKDEVINGEDPGSRRDDDEGDR